MPAAIDTTNGVNLFASFREPAWHRLGTVFDHEVTDYREMLKLAGLDGWNVRKEALVTNGGISVPTHNAIVRTNPVNGYTNVLGVVGDRYGIVQNEESFAFLQSLQDGARWETAGSIKDGKVVFGSIAFERETVLDASGVADVVKAYLLVASSHDGSTNVQGGRTAVRVVCQNTLDWALNDGLAQSFKIRHSSGVEARMAQEAEIWRATNVYFDQFAEDARSLFEVKVTDKKFKDTLVPGLFPKPEEDKKGSAAKWENRVGVVMQAWNGKPNAGIKGTGWGAVNALTEAAQWGRQLRGRDDAGNATEAATERFYAAGAGFDASAKVERQRIYTAVKELTGV